MNIEPEKVRTLVMQLHESARYTSTTPTDSLLTGSGATRFHTALYRALESMNMRARNQSAYALLLADTSQIFANRIVATDENLAQRLDKQ
ncbi:Uncharacterised protein [Corynebacterium kutscheri]|uniref:Uncharacterized protein n=1 Tax=Corynebacterium kutscheri TaxID=35755 RepID=A0A0F6TCG4_9CORY|nr:hypothetical protein [Corynebacterium kutscheri]AKE40669.1 hypothetical protein UL82_02220 [Corynebacterium kutscheri]VEH04741.1 Uncharacterised protein [Corynebacterium kutscheri]VEH11066.1 Uncharacterised protein [Corynebacterium kutscheri]VEH80456.1 Uncharacterised protein [Corynebacterium kutscheri]